jgi:SAM-dependent methyltransferase
MTSAAISENATVVTENLARYSFARYQAHLKAPTHGDGWGMSERIRAAALGSRQRDLVHLSLRAVTGWQRDGAPQVHTAENSSLHEHRADTTDIDQGRPGTVGIGCDNPQHKRRRAPTEAVKGSVVWRWRCMLGGAIGREQAAQDALAELPEPSDLTFSAAGNLYATHGLHAFAARCPPALADWAIDHFSRPGDTVLDPMSGSGTTLVEACLHGRVARGADIDPLARLISKAKATPVDLAVFDKTVNEVTRLLTEGKLDNSWRPDLPGWERWFRPEVAADLARLRAAISFADWDLDVNHLLWLCFSSLIVARTSVANARDLVHSRHHYRAWDEDPRCADRFIARVRRARQMMADYHHRLDARGAARPDVVVVEGDARALDLTPGAADLLFTSPPYCSALDYTRAHLFAVAWMTDVLGVTVKQYRLLGRDYVGSERAPLAESSVGQPTPPALGVAGVDEVVADLASEPRRAWVVHRYFREMSQVLVECARVTRPGGYVVLVVCPSNVRRVPIPTHSLLADIAAAAPPSRRLDLVDCRVRTIHDHRRVMPYLEAAFGHRMRTEYVMILRRPAA